MLRKRKIFYGWWIVLAGGVLRFLAGGVFQHGKTALFNPIKNAFGWSSASVSVAFSLQTLEGGILSPIVGFLVDKFGPRKLMLLGWLLFGLGHLWMSRINSLWEFYASFLLIAAGSSLGTMVVVYAAIANWFNKKRSRAFTLANFPMQFGGVLVPLVAWSIVQFGWRASLDIIGIVSLSIGLPLSLLFRDKPSNYGLVPDGEPAEVIDKAVDVAVPKSSREKSKHSGSSAVDVTWKAALKMPAFWLLSITYLVFHIGTGAVGVHIIPYLEDLNFSPTMAATVVMAVNLVGAGGGFICGFLGDFIDKRLLTAINLGLLAIGLFIFSLMNVETHWLIFLFLLSYAVGVGSVYPLRHAMIADFFGTKNYGTIAGLISTAGVLGGLASPIVTGWIFDTYGSYHIAWQLSALFTLPGILCILLSRPPRAYPVPTRVGAL